MRLTLFLDHQCNLRCRYCYNGRKFSCGMSRDVIRQALELGWEHARDGELRVSLFGGEPLLDVERVRQVVEDARESGARRGREPRFQVATNGTVLDQERLDLLRENHFLVQVSLDGCAAAHDAARRFRNGRPSHARVASNVRRLLDAGLWLRVMAVVDPDTVVYLAESLQFLADLGVRTIQLTPNLLAPWDGAAGDRFERALGELGQCYVELHRRGIPVHVDPLDGKMVTHLARGACSHVRCGFGVQDLAVSPTGRLYPCDRLVRQDDDPRVCVGDLEHGVDAQRLEALLAPRRTLDPECAACDLQERCMHWCGCANHETTGNPGRPSAVQCWMERCFMAQADHVAGILFAEANPCFLERYYHRGPLVQSPAH